MIPAAAITILSGIQLAVQAAPHIVELAVKGKEMFSALFAGGIITKEQQIALKARVDAISSAARAGQLPSSWDVEPDPEV